MARIVLTVESNTSKALQGITALKTQIDDLAKQLSNIKVNKALTAQITELSKYYQSLASAGKTVLESQAKVEAALNKSGTVAKSTATNIETLRKQYANLLSQIKSVEKQYPAKTFDSTKTSVEQTYKEVTDLSDAYRSNAKTADEVNSEAARLSQTYKTLAADVAALKVGNEKLAVSDPFSTKTGDSIARLQKRYQSLLTTIQGAEKYYPKGTFDSLTESVKQQITALNGLGNEYKQTGALSEASQKQLNGLNSAVLDQEAAFAQAKNSATNYHGTLRDLISGFLKFQVSAMLVMKPLQLLQSAISSINETLVETEKVVVSLQRVLDETVASGEISSELYQIAINLGQTFDNVQEIAQNFAKAGLSWQDTLKATEAAVLALNVAELTATESSEGLIAVMQQFNYEASELTYVIDVLNKAADKSAVDTADLLVALQKTGSYASAANLSLEETVGLIAALSEATAASGQNIGNALKSLFAYSSKASSLEMFASLSDEMKAIVDMYEIGNASILDVWEGLADVMTNLSDAQADLLEQWSSESGLETELGSALGDVYEQMTGVYDTAGVYRKNYFIALLNNFDEVYDVMVELSDAAGYTAEEQTKYMDTYEAKLNALNSQWQEFVNSEQGLLGLKKGLIDIASWLLNIIDSIGGIRTLLIALGGILATVLAPKIASFITSLPAKISQLSTSLTILNLKLKTTGITFKSLGSALQGIFGVIGVVATVVSTVVGAISSANEAAKQAAEEARQASISAWSDIEEEALQLNDLYNKFRDFSEEQSLTSEQESEYKKVQEDIIELLGERAKALNTLTAGTEEYTQKLEELTQAEIKEYRDRAQAATTAQFGEFVSGNIDLLSAIIAGKYSEVAREELETAASLGEFFNDSIDIILADYAERYGEGSTQYSEAVNQLYDAKEAYEAALKVATQAASLDFIYTYGSDLELEDVTRITDELIKQYGAGEEYRDLIKSWVIEYTGFSDEIENVNDKLDDQIKKISTLQDETIDKLIDDLKEIRDLEDQAATLEEKRLDIAEAREAVAEAEAEAAEKLAEAQEKLVDAQEKINDERLSLLEEQRDLQEELADKQSAAEEKRLDLLEKQQAVLEAQKALEEARDNRSVWRYNDSTGQYEWVTDESAVKEAEDELASAQESEQSAQEAYDEALKAVEEAKVELQDINLTIQDAEKAIEEAIAAGYDIPREILEEEKNIATGVRDAIQNYIEAQQAIKDQEKANEESIANAQKDLQEAIDAFNEYIEDQAWDDVISELESGNATNDSIKEILDNWKATSETQAEADTEWYQKIIDAIKDSVDVDITLSEDTVEDSNSYINKANELNTAFQQYSATWGSPNLIANRKVKQLVSAVTNSANSPEETEQAYRALLDYLNENYSDWDKLANYTYDSGGIANGAGFIAKATAEPETVNYPELTAKILSPVSNAQFDRYVRDMGILFETAKEYTAMHPMVQSTVGNTTTTNNNSSITINGVKIGSDMMEHPLGEVLRMVGIVPTK